MHFRNAYPLNSQLEAWIDLKVFVSSSWEKEKGEGRGGGGRGDGRGEEKEQEEKTALSKMSLRKNRSLAERCHVHSCGTGAGVFAGSFLSMCMCRGVDTSLTCQCQIGIM